MIHPFYSFLARFSLFGERRFLFENVGAETEGNAQNPERQELEKYLQELSANNASAHEVINNMVVQFLKTDGTINNDEIKKLQDQLDKSLRSLKSVQGLSVKDWNAIIAEIPADESAMVNMLTNKFITVDQIMKAVREKTSSAETASPAGGFSRERVNGMSQDELVSALHQASDDFQSYNTERVRILQAARSIPMRQRKYTNRDVYARVAQLRSQRNDPSTRYALLSQEYQRRNGGTPYGMLRKITDHPRYSASDSVVKVVDESTGGLIAIYDENTGVYSGNASKYRMSIDTVQGLIHSGQGMQVSPTERQIKVDSGSFYDMGPRRRVRIFEDLDQDPLLHAAILNRGNPLFKAKLEKRRIKEKYGVAGNIPTQSEARFNFAVDTARNEGRPKSPYLVNGRYMYPGAAARSIPSAYADVRMQPGASSIEPGAASQESERHIDPVALTGADRDRAFREASESLGASPDQSRMLLMIWKQWGLDQRGTKGPWAVWIDEDGNARIFHTLAGESKEGFLLYKNGDTVALTAQQLQETPVRLIAGNSPVAATVARFEGSSTDAGSGTTDYSGEMPSSSVPSKPAKKKKGLAKSLLGAFSRAGTKAMTDKREADDKGKESEKKEKSDTAELKTFSGICYTLDQFEEKGEKPSLQFLNNVLLFLKKISIAGFRGNSHLIKNDDGYAGAVDRRYFDLLTKIDASDSEEIRKAKEAISEQWRILEKKSDEERAGEMTVDIEEPEKKKSAPVEKEKTGFSDIVQKLEQLDTLNRGKTSTMDMLNDTRFLVTGMAGTIESGTDQERNRAQVVVEALTASSASDSEEVAIAKKQIRELFYGIAHITPPSESDKNGEKTDEALDRHIKGEYTKEEIEFFGGKIRDLLQTLKLYNSEWDKPPEPVSEERYKVLKYLYLDQKIQDKRKMNREPQIVLSSPKSIEFGAGLAIPVKVSITESGEYQVDGVTVPENFSSEKNPLQAANLVIMGLSRDFDRHVSDGSFESQDEILKIIADHEKEKTSSDEDKKPNKKVDITDEWPSRWEELKDISDEESKAVTEEAKQVLAYIGAVRDEENAEPVLKNIQENYARFSVKQKALLQGVLIEWGKKRDPISMLATSLDKIEGAFPEITLVFVFGLKITIDKEKISVSKKTTNSEDPFEE